MNSLKLRPLKVSVTVTLVFIIASSMICSMPVGAQNVEYIEKNFAWDYDGHHWTWTLNIPKELYEDYKQVSLYRRTRDGPVGYGFLTTTYDHYVRMLADKLNETATQMGYGSYDKVSFVLAFVQSLPYTSDNVTAGYNEYPRFPIETLVDDGGDCEDTSILFATLTIIMGFGTIYINPTNHYAVGILGSGLRGTYWEHPVGSNKTYYYCETTGNNFKIGQLPIEFTGKSAYLYDIDETKQYTPTIVVVPPKSSPTQAPVTSSGPTQRPTPTRTDDTNLTDPSLQPVMPLSFNLVSENPALFVVIVFAIGASIALTVWSARRPRPAASASVSASPPPPVASTSLENIEGEGKTCSHCGAGNKDYAAFCEKCGKQIA
ncbi:MAG: zinc ribbon domain-containing protein [Candidatus Bathyarchaeota archaeon]|nr:zinc ribbon domain-containing protein [Candidatus Bathyarchaeota archaeon]